MHGYQKQRISPNIQVKSLGDHGFRVSGTFESFVFTHRGRVFSYSSYFMLKGRSMVVGFSLNRRADSKAVWIVLLTTKRPVSWSILVPETTISGLVMQNLGWCAKKFAISQPSCKIDMLNFGRP